MPAGFSIHAPYQTATSAFGALPPMAKRPAQTPGASTAGNIWQGRVLFGNQGLTPAALKVLQTWAQEKRAAMPLLHQAIYPLKGERAGIEQMAAITQAMAVDSRLQDLPQSRAEELALLQPLILHERMLNDSDEQVRFQTVYMTERIAEPQAQAYMTHRALSHPDGKVRNYLFYLDALENQPDVDILDLAQDLHPWVRYQVARKLPELPDSDKRQQVLRALLQDEMDYIRMTAASNAYLLPDEAEGQRILKEALDNPDAQMRSYAISGILHLKDPAERAAQVRRSLQDDPKHASFFLGMRDELDDPDLWREIIETLANHPDPETRMNAIPHLEDESRQETIIMDLTADEKEHIGSWAVHKLSRQPEAVKNRYFLNLSGDANPRRRKAALYMLHNIQSKKLKNQVIRALLQDPDETVRAQALLYSKDNLKPSRATDRLILKALHAENPEVRAQAVWALPALTDPQQRTLEFLKLLKDDDKKVRQNAIRGLAAIEEPGVRDSYLRQFLGDGDPEIRQTAIFMDHWLDWPPGERDRLIETLVSDPAKQVREYLPNQLGGVFSEKFQRFLQSPYAGLVDAAIRAMDPESPLDWKDIMPAWILLLRSDADGTRLKQALTGYRDVTAHAMKQREKFTQESQKPMSEAAMALWLNHSAPNITLAITMMGGDSVKAKFDEKSLKFIQYLQMVQSVASHPDLGPLFYQTMHPGSRMPYPTWQVNRALEIVFGLMQLGKPEDARFIMKDIQQKRGINLASHQNLLLTRMGEMAGLAPEDFTQPDIQARLARWSDPYIFTIGSALHLLSEDSQKLLAQILEADLKNRTQAFLNDDSTPWGRANQATREAFQANGLDYGQWLGYNKSVTVQVGKRTLEISLWQRDAAKDLFVGSHSRTCLALDTRPEEMLDAYLNTMAQFAMIRDQQSGEPVGYIRTFWGLPENAEGPAKPELYIDNVAYAYEKEDPEAGRLLDIATDYAREFGRAVTGGRVPEVFLSRYIHTISPENVAERPMRVLGGSRTGDYYLFAVNQYYRSKLDTALKARVASGEKYGSVPASEA